MFNLTIGAWVVYILVVIFIMLCFVGFAVCVNDTKGVIVGFILSIVVSIIILFGVNWWYSNTASGARAIKTQESNFSNGIKRRVEVYDATGNLIKEYEGTFDLEYDDDRILFDDENGLRHVIYYPTGTVIIDELEE